MTDELQKNPTYMEKAIENREGLSKIKVDNSDDDVVEK